MDQALEDAEDHERRDEISLMEAPCKPLVLLICYFLSNGLNVLPEHLL